MPATSPRMGVAFGLLSAIFIFALGYSFGSTAEETHTLHTVGQTKGRIETVRERLQLCMENNEKTSGGHVSKKTAVEHLQRETENLEKDNLLLMDGIKTHHENQKQCRKQLEEEREKRTGTKNVNASEALLEYQYSMQRIAQQIKEASATLLQRPQLLRVIRAYHLENEDLQAQLVKKRKELAEREAALAAASLAAVANSTNITNSDDNSTALPTGTVVSDAPAPSENLDGTIAATAPAPTTAVVKNQEEGPGTNSPTTPKEPLPTKLKKSSKSSSNGLVGDAGSGSGDGEEQPPTTAAHHLPSSTRKHGVAMVPTTKNKSSPEEEIEDGGNMKEPSAEDDSHSKPPPPSGPKADGESNNNEGGDDGNVHGGTKAPSPGVDID